MKIALSLKPTLNYAHGKHISGLDGIRGIAILLVIIYHCFPSPITNFGWIGVDLFFVLSGFLITGILIDSKEAKNYYGNFILRRVLRIFPLYYFVLLLMLLIIPSITASFAGPDYNYYIHHQAWFWLYMQNWLYSRDGFPLNLILVHFWSLAVEEQFYLFWPWLVKLFPDKKLVKVCIILIIFSIIFRLYIGRELGLAHTYQYMSTLARMDALSIGAIIAVLIRRNRPLLEKLAPYCIIICPLFILLKIIEVKTFNFLSLADIFTFIDIFFGGVLIYSLSKKSFINRLVNLKSLIFLGKYSYGLYVYHFIIFNLLNNWLSPKLYNILHIKFLSVFIIGILTIIIAVSISLLSFHFLEKPFLGLKKRFTYKTPAVA